MQLQGTAKPQSILSLGALKLNRIIERPPPEVNYRKVGRKIDPLEALSRCPGLVSSSKSYQIRCKFITTHPRDLARSFANLVLRALVPKTVV